MKTEAQERAAIVAEAISWVGTRYHHMGRVKKTTLGTGGTDCAQLLYCVYRNVGLIDEIPLEYYPPDWHLNRSVERYMNEVMKHACETETPLPGDVVLYRMGRAYAHGAIVVDPGWPSIVHAFAESRFVLLDRGDDGRMKDRPHKFFTLW